MGLLFLSTYCFPLHLSSDLLIFEPHSWQVFQLDNFKMHCILTNEKLKKRDQYVFEFDTSCIPYFFWEEEEKHLLIIFCSRDLSVMNVCSFRSKSFKSNFHKKLFKSSFHDKLFKSNFRDNVCKNSFALSCRSRKPVRSRPQELVTDTSDQQLPNSKPFKIKKKGLAQKGQHKRSTRTCNRYK